MTKEEIRALLNDIESNRVERTVSTTNTDKFGQAICAFANDLPDYRLLGYLFLGVKDDGEAEYDFSYQTAVMVKEMKSPRGERALQEAVAQGFVTENGEKQTGKQPQKQPNLSIFEEKNGHKNGHEDDQKPSNMKENDEGKSQKPSELTISDSRQCLHGMCIMLSSRIAKRSIRGFRTTLELVKVQSFAPLTT